jgi:hypothetical protein
MSTAGTFLSRDFHHERRVATGHPSVRSPGAVCIAELLVVAVV